MAKRIDYGSDYYNWQKKIGAIGGYLNKFKFENEVKDTDVLMDFGCGGGFLLNQFNNKRKLGFEINRKAWEDITSKGIEAYDNFDNIQDDSIDTIISNHAMEHVPLPLNSLKSLYAKLKKGGTIVIVIPCEQPNESSFKYKPGDINQHLHTWCPMTFGNLATLAGFKVLKCEAFQHQWCSDWSTNWNKPDFHERCRQNAIQNKNMQIKLLATK